MDPVKLVEFLRRDLDSCELSAQSHCIVSLNYVEQAEPGPFIMFNGVNIT